MIRLYCTAEVLEAFLRHRQKIDFGGNFTPQDTHTIFKTWRKDSDGYYYQGEVNVKDERHGKGIIIDADNKFIWFGNWKNGKVHRKGTYINSNGTFIKIER